MKMKTLDLYLRAEHKYRYKLILTYTLLPTDIFSNIGNVLTNEEATNRCFLSRWTIYNTRLLATLPEVQRMSCLGGVIECLREDIPSRKLDSYKQDSDTEGIYVLKFFTLKF